MLRATCSRLFLGLCVSLVVALPAAAQVYKHVDENGTVSFSNAPTDPDYKLQFEHADGPVATGAPRVKHYSAPHVASGSAARSTSSRPSGGTAKYVVSNPGFAAPPKVYAPGITGGPTTAVSPSRTTTYNYDSRGNLTNGRTIYVR